MIVEVKWTGTASIWEDGKVKEYGVISGTLGYEADDLEEAASLYRDGYGPEDPPLLDTDFVAPGKSYSASNSKVLGGTLHTAFDQDEVEDWEFHSAQVLTVTFKAPHHIWPEVKDPTNVITKVVGAGPITPV